MASRIAKKNFQFAVLIKHVQFNNLGSFFLKLSVRSTFSADLSGIWVKDVTTSERFTPGYYVNTDVVLQHRKGAILHFNRNKYAFFLPRGFCSNDASHDVFLLVEAFQVDDKSGAQRKVGECKYGIFPRTNKPKANLNAKPGENMYKHTGVWTLLRTASTDTLKMHCGRMECTTTFSEMVHVPTEMAAGLSAEDEAPRDTGQDTERDLEKKTPLSKPTPTPAPQPTPRSPDVTFELPKSPTPPPAPLDDTRLKESPRTPAPQSSGERNQNWLLSRINMEDIIVILHGASNLPPCHDGSMPRPYCLLKTVRREVSLTQAISDIPADTTTSPRYEQTFVVEYEAKHAADEELVMQFVDKRSRDVLVSYHLPVSLLEPFHQYHLDMIMGNPRSANDVHTYVTLMRRAAVLPSDYSSPNFLAFQVYLQGFEKRLKNPAGKLIAVARIVPDYYSYNWVDVRETSTVKDTLITNGGLVLRKVRFPSPSRSAFQVQDFSKQGHPQVTLPGGPSFQPEWNHSFLFTQKREKATLFTPSAALVIEYFQHSKAQNDLSWRLRNPVGFSTLLLDEDIYKQLASSEASKGVQVTKLPVQDTELKTFHDRHPTVGLILRLITSERPDKLPASSTSSVLPYLQYMPQEEGKDTTKTTRLDTSYDTYPYPNYIYPSSSQDGYWLKQRVIKKYYPVQEADQLPSHDAMENILPEYKYIFVDPDPKSQPPGRMIANAASLPEDLDKTSLQLLDHQMRELERYRSAVHKMGEDILSLRQEIRDLEAYNSQLRRDLSQYNDATKLLLDSQELDGLTKPELAARYVALKQKLTRQTGELKDYKDRVQKLQNDLIKHNDQEKEFLRMSQAHTAQNELLHRLQRKAQKVANLEEACKKQEKVIEKMERLLSKKSMKDGLQTNSDLRAEALLDENKRLRDELENVREQNNLLSLGHGLKVEDDEEKLLLYEKLERFESRITSLERELAENARLWGREKSELVNKLHEAELGLRRISPISKPKLITTHSYENLTSHKPRRYSKAPVQHHKLINSSRDPFSY